MAYIILRNKNMKYEFITYNSKEEKATINAIPNWFERLFGRIDAPFYCQLKASLSGQVTVTI